MKKGIISFLLILLLILTTSSVYSADDQFLVRVIYFQPKGVDPVNHEKYNEIIIDIREFFRNEMIRLGYGDKSFTLETDVNDDLIIHTVKGRHAGEHYTGEVFNAYYQKISKEIPFAINNTTNRKQQDNIYIIIVGGVEIVYDSPGSPWGAGWGFAGDATGGAAAINENFEKLYPDHLSSIIAHELAHAFGLYHNVFDDSLMGSLPFGGPSYITDFEARLLNKHHLLNDVHVLNTRPEIVGNLSSTAIGIDTVRFEIQVRGNANLYHCQVHEGQNYVGSDSLDGRNGVAQVDVPRSFIVNGDDLNFTIYDVNGNNARKRFDNIQLPDPILENVIENEGPFKYLTLRHKLPDSIVPINNQDEWCGWQNAGTFEKPPKGPSPNLPDWYIHVPKLDEWDSWIYSHAISRFVYDVSGGEYNRFDAHFYLPNPCDGDADVEVVCLVDGVEIYRSEILRAPAAQNKHLQIDFPKDTKRLTIQVTDAGDGIRCDHFAFGEARVLLVNADTKPDANVKNEEPDGVICEHCIPDTDIEIDGVVEEDLGVDPKDKLTTIWATLKAR